MPEPPLAQLEQMIAGTGGADLTVTLSNHFMRYAVLAPQKNIANPAELQAYVGFHMREIFGERAMEWMTSVSAWDPIRGGVCAAFERGLFEQLGELAARCKMRLKYVEPYLTAAFDHWHQRFDDQRAWFALVEAGRFCLVLLENGGWQRVSNQRVVENVENELLAALDQEAILFSEHKEAIEAVYLFAPEHPELMLPEDCGRRVIPLHSESVPAPLHYPSSSIVPDTVSECAVSS